MWSRKRLDIGWRDLAFGAVRCLLPADRAAAERRTLDSWSDDGDALACLSVRSGFDLLLSALSLPPKSEVLVSAVTIPNMIEIVAAHGLRAVPVDLTPAIMSPRLDVLRRAITPATRAILAAHLFGGRIDFDPLAELAQEHGLLLFEDCAQAYCGPGFRGHPRADVSMFSFGPIKTATALGGAIVRVRDDTLRKAVVERQANYPIQSRWRLLGRIAKYAGLKGLSAPSAFAMLYAACRLAGLDADRLLNRSVRGFAKGELFVQLRRRPSAALLALLARRLRRFDGRRLEARIAASRAIIGALADYADFPGSAAAEHCHWVLPIRVDEPDRLIAALRAAGFDATQGQSLCVVPPAERPELDPCTARDTMAGIVFVPCYPEMPPEAAARLIETLIQFFREPAYSSASLAGEPIAMEGRAPSPGLPRRRTGDPRRDMLDKHNQKARSSCTTTPTSNASST